MGADSTISRAPDARFLFGHPAHFIALGFGSGLVPWAPGTFGTLVAFPICWALELFLPPLAVAFVAIPLFFIGVWACEVTGRDLGAADHGAMVWDEIVAFLPLAALASASLLLSAVPFALLPPLPTWEPLPLPQLRKRRQGGPRVTNCGVCGRA